MDIEQLIADYGTLADTVRAVPLHSDGDAQARYLSEAAAILPTINEHWAWSKSLLNEERAKASEEYATEKYAKLSKRLVENLIDGKCTSHVRMEAMYERLSRSCVHCIEAVRSLLSNSKAERYATSRHSGT